MPSSMHSNVQLLYLLLFFAVGVGVAVLVAWGPFSLWRRAALYNISVDNFSSGENIVITAKVKFGLNSLTPEILDQAILSNFKYAPSNSY